MANTNDELTDSSTKEAGYPLLKPHDFGLRDIHTEPTICGLELNLKASTDGASHPVIGGIIAINRTFYAMTSVRALLNAKYPYDERLSSREFDWALCEIDLSLAMPNLNGTDRLLDCMYNIDNRYVEVLAGPDWLVHRVPLRAHILTKYPNHIDERIDRTVDIGKLLPLEMDRLKNFDFPTGAWVVWNDSVQGYLVDCERSSKGWQYCYMMPMETAFQSIKEHLGLKGKERIVFGKELHEMMKRAREWFETRNNIAKYGKDPTMSSLGPGYGSGRA